MRRAGPAIALFVAFLACAGSPARGEMGPCQPDKFGGLTCGAGRGAARVIGDTLSPDKRLAFAWRNPEDAPDAQPDPDDKLDFLLVRLTDGAVLAKSATGYWATGETHANRLMEQATWSPDGRLVARAYQSRFETERFMLYALDAKDALAGTLDLKKIIAPALRARLKPGTRDAAYYVVAISGTSELSLSDAGLMQLTALLWLPKSGPTEYYDVALRITRNTGGLSAHISSLKKAREQK